MVTAKSKDDGNPIQNGLVNPTHNNFLLKGRALRNFTKSHPLSPNFCNTPSVSKYK